MAKLKCWKKKKKDEYWNSKRLELIYVRKIPKKKLYEVGVSNPNVGYTIKITETKDEGLKKAKKYMKEHDRC